MWNETINLLVEICKKILDCTHMAVVNETNRLTLNLESWYDHLLCDALFDVRPITKTDLFKCLVVIIILYQVCLSIMIYCTLSTLMQETSIHKNIANFSLK